MRSKLYLIALLIFAGTAVAQAQKSTVDTQKSSIAWVGKKIGGQHNGTIQLKSGALEVKNNGIVSGKFTIDMQSIKNLDLTSDSYNKKLVGHLKSDDFFGVEKFPTATLNITKGSKFKNNKASVTGAVTIKNKTENLTFDVVKNGNVYTATINVDRSKFDVRYGSNSFFDNLGDKAIDDIFVLDIELVLQ